MQTNKFTLMQMFSIVDGRLSLSGMDSVYEVLGWLSNDEGITTLGLTWFMDKLKANKPAWWNDVQNDIDHCKKMVGNDFNKLMQYIETTYNHEYDIPQF